MYWLQVTSQLILTSESYLQQSCVQSCLGTCDLRLALNSGSSSVSQVLEFGVLNHTWLQFFKIPMVGENCPTGMTKDLPLSTLRTTDNPQATCTTQDLLCHGSPHDLWSLRKGLTRFLPLLLLPRIYKQLFFLQWYNHQCCCKLS